MKQFLKTYETLLYLLLAGLLVYLGVQLVNVANDFAFFLGILLTIAAAYIAIFKVLINSIQKLTDEQE